MYIDGKTRTCGLIGNPVEHTLSPAIHHFLAEKTGQNLAYLPFLVEEERLEDAVNGAYALNLLGVNVTVPYKSDVLPFLSDVDPLAKQIGAVNTLVRTDEGFKGYNTDMPGLYRAMQSDGVNIEGESVMILGAGGVARAVAMMLAKKNAKEILILNRTLERALAIEDEINEIEGRHLVSAMPLDAWKELTGEKRFVVIQATKVGMHPFTEETVITEEVFYQKVKVGYDLIYNPLETRFMQLVKKAGGRAYPGLKMLLYQGIIAFELWTGETITEEIANDAYAALLAQMNK